MNQLSVLTYNEVSALYPSISIIHASLNDAHDFKVIGEIKYEESLTMIRDIRTSYMPGYRIPLIEILRLALYYTRQKE
jgi:hypothetical protein